MVKRRTESDIAWIEVNKSGFRTNCFYGFMDGNNVHGHTVLSGSEIIYQRNISGANLVLSGSNFIVSEANLILKLY